MIWKVALSASIVIAISLFGWKILAIYGLVPAPNEAPLLVVFGVLAWVISVHVAMTEWRTK